MKKSVAFHVLLCLIYVSLLVYLVLFAQGFGRVATLREYNLVPFNTITRYLRYRSSFGDINFYINIYGNIIAFMPLGYFVFVLEKKHRLYKSILFPFITSLCIEIAQIKMSVGSFDVDDIILNTMGGFVVYFLMYIVYLILKLFRRGKYNEKEQKK